MKEELVVEKTGSCKKVYIPRGYCTIYLQGQAKDNRKDNIQISNNGHDVCIENIASDMPCQKTVNKKKVNKK